MALFLDYTKVIELKTLLDVSPCGMKFIGYKTIEESNRISYIECTRFEVAIYEDEYGIRHDYYCPVNPLDCSEEGGGSHYIPYRNRNSKDACS